MPPASLFRINLELAEPAAQAALLSDVSDGISPKLEVSGSVLHIKIREANTPAEPYLRFTWLAID